MALRAAGRIVNRLTQHLGYKITKVTNLDPLIEQDTTFTRIYAACKDATMTSKERMYALYTAVQYVVAAKIPGAFVECGVWKGGSTMLIAYTLQSLGVTDRTIYLYDTYEGMSEPTADDVAVADTNDRAVLKWQKGKQENHNAWCYASLEEVKANMRSTSYPEDKLVFVKGKVEDTIPQTMPGQIALLRLDTDLYESTRHELHHLYPLLVERGVLILDDYGCWAGSKKAVDEYFQNQPLLLSRIDYTGRVALKTA